jgi:RecB family exonuclease
MSIKQLFSLSLLMFAAPHILFGMDVKPAVKRARTQGGAEKDVVDDLQTKARRSKSLYNPASQETFKLSRSRLENFMRCHRCFYLDRRLGVSQPAGFPFTLNNAVDTLLKKEFDGYREKQIPHPICVQNGVNAVPFKHPDIEKWRDALRRGVEAKVPNTNITLHGGLDDVWIDQKTQELIVVDYKATSKQGEVTLDADWQISYKRQAEVYQWLLRKNGFRVSDTAYFVYCNGKKDVAGFNKQLLFDIFLLPYVGDDSWVEPTVLEAQECLESDTIPDTTRECDYCKYLEAACEHVDNL